jgi:outer membrane protein assembly factor BamD
MTLLIFAFFCSQNDEELKLDPSQLGNDKEIYEKANKLIKRQPDRGRLLFKSLIQLNPNSVYAQKAKIGIADSYYREKGEGTLMLAVSEYEEFVNMFPNSPDAVYAKYQIGMCFYRGMRKPGRDQDNTYQAIEAFENMIKRFPGTRLAEDAKEKIEIARLNLARHYFRIGMSNYYIKAFQGAVKRFKSVLNDFPEFEQKDELYFFTGKSYFALRDFDTAIAFFQRTMEDYPESRFARRSRRMLRMIEKEKRKARDVSPSSDRSDQEEKTETGSPAFSLK